MSNIVVDSSVWIDFFNKKTSHQIEIVRNLIFDSPVVTTITILPIILQEVLQGIQSNKHFEIVKENLQGFNYIFFDAYTSSVSAAQLYRYLQKKGITIRKPNDCLIASVGIDQDLFLLHNDRDFDNIAKHTSLKIYK
ncbi:MAG: twitching motility protein PilT [Ferruginibacter sp.]|nr:twitching motility protein PilT [Ferruginibacter sp.]